MLEEYDKLPVTTPEPDTGGTYLTVWIGYVLPLPHKILLTPT
jgi:hypothetical protein